MDSNSNWSVLSIKLLHNNETTDTHRMHIPYCEHVVLNGVSVCCGVSLHVNAENLINNLHTFNGEIIDGICQCVKGLIFT